MCIPRFGFTLWHLLADFLSEKTCRLFKHLQNNENSILSRLSHCYSVPRSTWPVHITPLGAAAVSLGRVALLSGLKRRVGSMPIVRMGIKSCSAGFDHLQTRLNLRLVQIWSALPAILKAFATRIPLCLAEDISNTSKYLAPTCT